MTLYQSFVNYLQKKNIPKESGSSEGTILFKYNNLNYVFVYDVEEPYYFRLLLPRISDCNDGNDIGLYRYALELSNKYKVGKMVIINNSIWVSFEQIVMNPNADNDFIYDMAIRVLSSFRKSFSQYHK